MVVRRGFISAWDAFLASDMNMPLLLEILLMEVLLLDSPRLLVSSSPPLIDVCSSDGVNSALVFCWLCFGA